MAGSNNSSLNAIGWSLFEKYGVTVFSLVIGVLMARSLMPADYGLIGILNVFLAVSMVFVHSGFGAAYIQKKNATDLDANTIFSFNLLVSSFFYGALFFMAPLIAQFYEMPELVLMLRVLGVLLIINAFSIIQVAQLTKNVDLKKKSMITIVSTVLAGMVGLLMVYQGYGVWSIVGQQITQGTTLTLGLWFGYSWRPSWMFSMESLKELFGFSGWLLLGNISAAIFENIYSLVIGRVFPLAQLGFYNRSMSYISMALFQPSVAINVVSFPIFSKFQSSPRLLRINMRAFIKYLQFYILPLAAVLYVVSGPLFLLLLTQKWVPMVPYFKLLLIIGVLYSLQSMNIQMLNAQGKSKLNYYVLVFKIVLRAMNIYVMSNYSVAHIIWGEIIISFLSWCVIAYLNGQLIKYGLMSQIKDIWKEVLIGIVTLVLAVVAAGYMAHPMLQILGGGALVILCYGLLNYLFNRPFTLQNYQMIKSRLIK